MRGGNRRHLRQPDRQRPRPRPCGPHAGSLARSRRPLLPADPQQSSRTLTGKTPPLAAVARSLRTRDPARRSGRDRPRLPHSTP